MFDYNNYCLFVWHWELSFKWMGSEIKRYSKYISWYGNGVRKSLVDCNRYNVSYCIYFLKLCKIHSLLVEFTTGSLFDIRYTRNKYLNPGIRLSLHYETSSLSVNPLHPEEFQNIYCSISRQWHFVQYYCKIIIISQQGRLSKRSKFKGKVILQL